MKKLIFLLVCALVSANTFASVHDAGENVIVKIEKGEMAKTIALRLANLEMLGTTIDVQDVGGIVWFTKYINRENGYSASIDLNGMPSGDYVLSIKNHKRMWAQAFAMDEEEIAFFKNPSVKPTPAVVASLVSFDLKEKGKLITHFTDQGNASLGAQLANLQGMPAELYIISMGRGFMFTEKIDGKHGFAHPFNLEGAVDGHYFLYVHAADASAIQFFTLKKGDLTLGDMQRLDRPLAQPAKEIISSGY